MDEKLMRTRIREMLMGKIAMGAGMKRKKNTSSKSKRVKKNKTRGKGKGKKTTNPWIQHVKKYAREHGVDYPTALKKAGSSYRGRGSYKAKKKRAVNRKKIR